MKFNTNFGKLDESGNVEYSQIPLIINGENLWTNIPENYIKCGYYPIKNTKAPEKEGFYYSPYYIIEENFIVQKWEEHEIPAPVEGATNEEIQNAIKEGVNSI